MANGFRVQRDTDRYAAKVAALIAKADSTEYPAEAEALMAKAHELMARYGINDSPVAPGVPADSGRDAAPPPPPQPGAGLVFTAHQAQAPWKVVVVAGVVCGLAFGVLFGSGVIQNYLGGHMPAWAFQRWEGDNDIVTLRVVVEATVGALLGLLCACAWRRRCKRPTTLASATAGSLTLIVLLALFGVVLLAAGAVCFVSFVVFSSATRSRPAT